MHRTLQNRWSGSHYDSNIWQQCQHILDSSCRQNMAHLHELPLTINTSIRDRGWEWWITIANYDCILGHIQRRKLTMCNEELMIRSQICLRLHSYKGFPMIRWGYPLFWRGTQAPSSRVTHPFHSSLLRVAHALYWTGTDTEASDNVKVSLSNSTLTDRCSSAARKEMDGKVFT